MKLSRDKRQNEKEKSLNFFISSNEKLDKKKDGKSLEKKRSRNNNDKKEKIKLR